MAVAGIAYDHLTPKTKAAVDALLMRQKDYGLWISEMPAGYTDKARFAFMKAATWPDDIRKTPDDRPIWHYIDLPVIAPGYTPDPVALLPVKPNAETQIGAETTLLSSSTATDGERAIALCWVEHLVGDIHQPLHTASLYSPAFPKGDRGGNSENLSAAQVKDDPIEKEAAACAVGRSGRHDRRSHGSSENRGFAGNSRIQPEDVSPDCRPPHSA